MPRLTKTAIDRAGCADGRPYELHWDDEIPGFGLRVTATGVKAYVFRYRLGGRQRMDTIGRHGALTPTQAREMARDWYGRVRAGESPKGGITGAPTFGEVADAYVETHSRRHKKPASQRHDQSHLRVHLRPAWGSVPIDQIDRAAVAKFHDRMSRDRPAQANRILALISHIWTFATSRGLLPEGHPNPAKGIQKNREVKRDRFLSEAELGRLRETLEAWPNPWARALFKLYLAIGCRKSELQNLTWDDLGTVPHGGRRIPVIRIPDTKSNRPHTIPLAPQIVAIFEAIPRLDGNPFVFVGRKHGRPLDAMAHWRQIRAKAGLDDVRIHDLRHSAITFMVSMLGVPLPVAREIANHSSTTVTDRYSHASLGLMLEALEKQADMLDG
jgi:integrase